MPTYFATFVPGAENIVTSELKKALAKTTISYLLPGFVLFTSPATKAQIAALGFLSNSFSLVKELAKPQQPPLMLLDEVTQSAELRDYLTFHRPTTPQTFRVVISTNNTIVSTFKGPIRRLEEQITRFGFCLDRLNPQTEFWLYLLPNRRVGYFGQRINTRKGKIAKGELRQDLTQLLVALSDPQADDVFLDPFAGSGAIGKKRANYPAHQLFLGDIDSQTTNRLRKKFTPTKKALRSKNTRSLERFSTKTPVTIGRWDALHLTTFSNESVNKIVTDPPWGMFHGRSLNLIRFYTAMLTEFVRILRREGLMVILTGNPFAMNQALQKFHKQVEVKKTHQLHFAGKDTVVFVLAKQTPYA